MLCYKLVSIYHESPPKEVAIHGNILYGSAMIVDRTVSMKIPAPQEESKPSQREALQAA